ncbi:unnamed protein product, partial [Ectocarpus fasciculatus]
GGFHFETTGRVWSVWSVCGGVGIERGHGDGSSSLGRCGSWLTHRSVLCYHRVSFLHRPALPPSGVRHRNRHGILSFQPCWSAGHGRTPGCVHPSRDGTRTPCHTPTRQRRRRTRFPLWHHPEYRPRP